MKTDKRTLTSLFLHFCKVWGLGKSNRSQTNTRESFGGKDQHSGDPTVVRVDVLLLEVTGDPVHRDDVLGGGPYTRSEQAPIHWVPKLLPNYEIKGFLVKRKVSPGSTPLYTRSLPKQSWHRVFFYVLNHMVTIPGHLGSGGSFRINLTFYPVPDLWITDPLCYNLRPGLRRLVETLRTSGPSSLFL